ncbi:hypothetical protein [Methylomonas rosea]|uniref:Uncharacterized protein n=1 Tax=Methylomonas rosea TaxID=2952227 RepID=A0ABT1TND2_9GAMM|nr:hypothetical protein [Methylomonas sp. WSC-7]MCQ8116279.1 hypothetical protein [Methylomonas sp. WSC-7]
MDIQADFRVVDVNTKGIRHKNAAYFGTSIGKEKKLVHSGGRNVFEKRNKSDQNKAA